MVINFVPYGVSLTQTVPAINNPPWEGVVARRIVISSILILSNCFWDNSFELLEVKVRKSNLCTFFVFVSGFWCSKILRNS